LAVEITQTWDERFSSSVGSRDWSSRSLDADQASSSSTSDSDRPQTPCSEDTCHTESLSQSISSRPDDASVR